MARVAAAAVALMVVALAAAGASADSFQPYTNHTVGGAAGTDYSAWASKRSFFVGDYLIFTNNGNSTVIQTYNRTTYRLCSLDQDYGNLTSQQWRGLDTGPLTEDGGNYFFSSADGGTQCRNGMKFHIVVLHRQGQPSPSPSPAASPPAVSAELSPSIKPQTDLNSGGRRGRGPWALSTFVGILLLLMSSG
ncbi:unnamed protein product [Spirodela intermedia]|uniref:Phytocyanin domain-containing protein n=1 Tax=Spirodela intermedia TaxID=51605 RepID=A0A7I8IQX4_SPIIN|nr:unnamed protein product [Spirodela intermedia]CAA6659945.1 unnamed protein product [Spirodela intermedia]